MAFAQKQIPCSRNWGRTELVRESYDHIVGIPYSTPPAPIFCVTLCSE